MSDGGSTMVKKKKKKKSARKGNRDCSVEESYNVKRGFSEKILFQQYESFIKKIL